MNTRWLIALFFCLYYSNATHAGTDSSFVQTTMSEATNLPLYGWNKVLMLRNGNTIVLHLALREKMMVKVFDSSHKEISSVSQHFKIIGETDLEASAFKGFYDINGIPTLFMMQIIDGHNCLVRVCFNPETGKLAEEKIVYESPGIAERGYRFFVSKPEASDDYAVFCFKGFSFGFLKKEDFRLPVLYFNGKHQLIDKKHFVVSVEDHKYIDFTGFEFDAQHRTYIGVDYSIFNPDRTYSRGVYVGCAQQKDSVFTMAELIFNSAGLPLYAFFKYNDFNNTLNVTIATGYRKQVDVKANWYYENVFNTYFCILGKDMEVLSFKHLNYAMGNDFQKSGGDTLGNRYNGMAMRMYTNKFGVTTLWSEQHRINPSYKGKQLLNTSMGNICMTKLNDEGEETVGIIYPKDHHVMTAVYADDLAFRGTTTSLFREYRDQAYINQFPSFECLSYRNLNYLFVNDYVSNTGKAFKDKRETVTDYERAEAFCYRINANDESEQVYLFGKPGADESRSLMIESIDQQPAQRKLCGLVSVRQGKKVQLHVAWCTLN